MNKILVISAYPKGKTSLGESLLADAGAEIKVLNLFDFQLPIYRGQKELNEVSVVFNELDKHDKWLFIFPVWWSNMPGTLKNFFDWAILYGLIYDGKSVPKPALEGRNKKAALFCTSGDVYGKYKEDVTNLIAEEILPYWGVEVVGSLFIEDTYNFNDERFKAASRQLKEIIASL